MADGEFYDKCGRCDTEVDAVHRSGGESARSADHHEWSIFSCDPHAGGCGNAWSKTTRQGAAKRDAQGAPTAGLTEAAQVQRAFFTPTERYKHGYEQIDWGK